MIPTLKTQFLASAFFLLTSFAAACDGTDQTVTGDSSGSCMGSQLTQGGIMSWQEDDNFRCAPFVSATLMAGTTSQTLEILGGGVTYSAISLSVTAPGIVGGAYFCQGDGGVLAELDNVDGTKPIAPLQNCSIVVTSPGATGGPRAAGTFSGTLSPTLNAAKTISNGVFDVPIFGG